VNVGDLRMFRNGRNPITKEINYVLGLIIEIHEEFDPMDDWCKVLSRNGRIQTFHLHGSRGISDEENSQR
jgi:hypothetical protein